MPKPMKLEQRKILETYKDSPLTDTEISVIAGIFYKSASNEYKKNGGRSNYRAEDAHEKVLQNMKKMGNHLSQAKALTIQDMQEIEKYKDTNLSGSKIGKLVGKHKNIVNREFKRFTKRSDYNAEKAFEMKLKTQEDKYTKYRKMLSPIDKKEEYEPEIDKDLFTSFTQSIGRKKAHSSPTSNNSNVPKFPLKIWIDRFKEEKASMRANWHKEKKYFEFWLKHLGESIATEISPSEIEHIADLLLHQKKGKTEKTLSPETRRKYVLYLSSLYTIAIFDWKWAEFNPLSCVNMKRSGKPYQTTHSTKFQIFDEFSLKFVALVKEKIKENNLTNEKAAILCGTSVFTFKGVLEVGKNVTIRLILRVCQGLGITMEIGCQKNLNV